MIASSIADNRKLDDSITSKNREDSAAFVRPSGKISTAKTSARSPIDSKVPSTRHMIHMIRALREASFFGQTIPFGRHVAGIVRRRLKNLAQRMIRHAPHDHVTHEAVKKANSPMASTRQHARPEVSIHAGESLGHEGTDSAAKLAEGSWHQASDWAATEKTSTLCANWKMVDELDD